MEHKKYIKNCPEIRRLESTSRSQVVGKFDPEY